MAREETGSAEREHAPSPEDGRKPDGPPDLTKRSWTYTAKAAFAEFGHDQCTDLAAALTYYSVLALFPGLLALVSLLGIFGQGQSTTQTMLDIVRQIGQGNAAEQLRGPLDQMTHTGSAGFALVFGLLGALWSASGYVGAFGRALNRIYQIDEGRPPWKLRPQQLLITAVSVVMAALVLVGLVLSGSVARSVGDAIGLGSGAVTVWNIAKWPVILLVVVALVAMLYYSTPNIKQPKFRWISVGASIAIITWIIGSILFGLYVSQFGHYNKTYGSLAGVIVFLLWLWITNLALLFGAEVDSELERARELQSGIEAEEVLQLPPRDTRGSDKRRAKRRKRVEQARALRESAGEPTDEDAPEATGENTQERTRATRH
jgi:membrane protein